MQWMLAASLVAIALSVVPEARAAAGDVVLASRADGASGASGNSGSTLPDHPLADITPDGSQVAFLSRATNLTADATGGPTQAFLRSPADGTTELLSAGDGAGGAGTIPAASPAPGVETKGFLFQLVGFVSHVGNLAAIGTGKGADRSWASTGRTSTSSTRRATARAARWARSTSASP